MKLLGFFNQAFKIQLAMGSVFFFFLYIFMMQK